MKLFKSKKGQAGWFAPAVLLVLAPIALFLIMGIPVTVAAASLFGFGTFFWIALAVFVLIFLFRRR